jgi:HEAT repeat protein
MKKEDPLQVLKNSTDGDKRSRAYRALQEPKQHGGSDQDQNVVIKILSDGATVEREPLCRLGAIAALRSFHDPRAVEILKEAYYKSGAAPFSPDTTIVIKVQVLSALGETANPAAVELLVRVLREPPVLGTDEERQHKMDERIAAARALGRFRDPQAANALVEVLGKEKDVALRHRANDALQAATGQDLPPDAQKWQDYLQKNPLRGTEVVQEPGPVQKLMSPVLPTGWRQ